MNNLELIYLYIINRGRSVDITNINLLCLHSMSKDDHQSTRDSMKELKIKYNIEGIIYIISLALKSSSFNKDNDTAFCYLRSITDLE